MKFLIVFIVAVICIFATVINSSGISQFYADRDVAMQIADSETALIGLPESITLNIKVKREGDTSTITDMDHNLTVKNNMPQPIYLERMDFDDWQLQFADGGLLIGIGENRKVDLAESIDGDAIMTPTNSKATLYFKWNSGKMAVEKNVTIHVTIME